MAEDPRRVEHLAAMALADSAPAGWQAFVDAVAAVDEIPEAARPAIAAAIARPDVDHQLLERPLRRLLERDVPGLADAVARIHPEQIEAPLEPAVGDALLDHALLPALLSRTIVRHPGWEEVLRTLRRQLLREAARGDISARLPVLQGFARQGFHTEFAWWGSHEARALRAMLEAGIADRLEDEPLVGELAATLCAIAMYSPLRVIEGAPSLLARGDWRSSPLAGLFEIELAQPLAEIGLLDAIDSLDDDDAGAGETPFPRLVTLPRVAPERVDRVLRAALPHVDIEPWDGPARVLVAPCATGRGVLEAVMSFAGARVLGVDPSRRKLAAALRRVRDWGAHAELAVGGAELVEGDFDLVLGAASVERLPSLADRLRPGGLIRVDVRLATGGRALGRFRELFAQHGWTDSRVGVRRARRATLELPADHAARSVVYWPDFYSVSGARELCLPGPAPLSTTSAREALDALGFEVLGVACDPWAAARYGARWPDDPVMLDAARWEQLATAEPELLGRIGQIWARRR